MTTVKIDPELTREVFEAAQAVRLLKVFSVGIDYPVQVCYSKEGKGTWTVMILGYVFVATTLLEALEIANPLFETFSAGRKV